MKSELAEAARRELLAATGRMTAEQRLAVYLEHCQLMALLRLAGQAGQANPSRHAPGNAD